MNEQLPILVSVKEVARQLGVSIKTIRRRIADGTLVARHIGKNVRVDAASVTRLIAETGSSCSAEDAITLEQSTGPVATAPNYKVYEEKGRGFVVRYYGPDGRRHSHRVRDARGLNPANFEEAEAYAAVWIEQNIPFSGKRKKVSSPVNVGPTFEEFANRWLSGELHERYPDHVRKKVSGKDDAARLKRYVFPHIGSEPIVAFAGATGIDLVERVVVALPPSLSAATRRHVLQVINRVLSLAVYPARLLASHPLPRGFVPRGKCLRAKSYLYPQEEKALMACAEVPVLERLFYGCLAREGFRVSELLSLTWRDVDFRRGVVHLDANKTEDARAWALGEDVVEALRRWRRLFAEVPDVHARIIRGADGTTIDPIEAARRLRAHLRTAGVNRPQLFDDSPKRIPIRAHDLRASFVTVSLATGKRESWVTDRTGHQSSQMLYAYKRAARTHAELNLGTFAPLHEAIPELKKLGSAT